MIGTNLMIQLPVAKSQKSPRFSAKSFLSKLQIVFDLARTGR